MLLMQPLMRLVAERQFDTVYHEHFSYLSLQTVSRIFAAAGLRVVDRECGQEGCVLERRRGVAAGVAGVCRTDAAEVREDRGQR